MAVQIYTSTPWFQVLSFPTSSQSAILTDGSNLKNKADQYTILTWEKAQDTLYFLKKG